MPLMELESSSISRRPRAGRGKTREDPVSASVCQKSISTTVVPNKTEKVAGSLITIVSCAYYILSEKKR